MINVLFGFVSLSGGFLGVIREICLEVCEEIN